MNEEQVLKQLIKKFLIRWGLTKETYEATCNHLDRITLKPKWLPNDTDIINEPQKHGFADEHEAMSLMLTAQLIAATLAQGRIK